MYLNTFVFSPSVRDTDVYVYICMHMQNIHTYHTLEFSIKMMLKHIIRAYSSIWNWLDFPLTAAL